MAEQERLVIEHLLAGDEGFFELGKELGSLGGPLFETAAAEYALFVADEQEAVVFRDVFLPIDVVEFERHAFDVILDITPDDLLDAHPVMRKKAKREFFANVFGNHLRRVVRLKNDSFAVLKDRNLIITLAR